MKPYKLKHLPTGLYYQPHKHGGSNLSKRGKIYQTSIHGLSSQMKRENGIVHLYTGKNSIIYKITKDILVWEDVKYLYNQVRSITSIKEWIKEEI